MTSAGQVARLAQPSEILQSGAVLDVICVGRNGNEPFRIDVADLDALTFQR